MPARMTVVVLLFLATASSKAMGLDAGADAHALRVARRDARAVGGSEFARRVRDLPTRDQQCAALDELERGNLPDFLRRALPVHLTARGAAGGRPQVTIFVLPDYLAVGSDHDFLYVPLAFASATAVARDLGFVLPTPKMVDAIYAQSAHHLTPVPLPAGPLMRSIPYLQEHQRRIEAQRRGLPLGELISGHKKDLVLTERLIQQPGRVAIYGWHRRIGDPIQPLSTVHGQAYEDYSHGVRLVSETVLVDGRERSIYEALEDPALAPALTYEGVLPDARRLMGLPTVAVAQPMEWASAQRR